MRFTPTFMVSALVAVTLSGTTVGAPAVAQALAPLSLAMLSEGERLQAGGDLDAAIGYYESALAADPRNVNAYIGLGQIAAVQDLHGKAIGFFREALVLQPDNRAALAAQGDAMVARGAIDRARANLARLRTLCATTGCAEVAALDRTINAAGQRTVLRRDEVLPQPIVGVTPPPATN